MNKQVLVSTATFLLAASSLLAADVRDGLVAYWPLNTVTGGTPMTTPDVVAGNTMNGPTKDGGTALVAGRYGNAVTFSGSAITDYLFFTNAPGADTGLPISKVGSWTVALWVKGDPQAAKYYFTEGSSSSTAPQTLLTTVNATNTTQVLIRDASGNTPSPSLPSQTPLLTARGIMLR